MATFADHKQRNQKCSNLDDFKNPLGQIRDEIRECQMTISNKRITAAIKATVKKIEVSKWENFQEVFSIKIKKNPTFKKRMFLIWEKTKVVIREHAVQLLDSIKQKLS